MYFMEIAFSIFFYMGKEWQCGDGRMANRYMFRGLAVSIHGPAHRQFEKLMDALST